jgi:mono/diheme cytochrome c family protein
MWCRNPDKEEPVGRNFLSRKPPAADSAAAGLDRGLRSYRRFRAMVLLLISVSIAPPTAQSRNPGAAAADAGAPESVVGNADNGKRLFVRDGCYECHGIEGQGAVGIGPRLAPDPISLRALTNYLRKPAGVMPPYSAAILPDQEAADIHAYLKARPRPAGIDRIPTFKNPRRDP